MSHKSTPGAQRAPSFFWQGALILLPVVVMTVLGWSAILRDKAAVEREAEQRARELLDQIAPGLAQRFAVNLARFDLAANEWAELQGHRLEHSSSTRMTLRATRSYLARSVEPRAWFQEWFTNWDSAFPNLAAEDALPNRLLFTADGALPWPPGYESPPRPPQWLLEFNAEQRAAWQAFRRIQASDADAGEREAAAQRFLQTDPPEEARANVEFLDLAEGTNQASSMETASALLVFAELHPGAAGESGLALASLATARALSLATQAGQYLPFANALRNQTRHAPSLLTPRLLDQARLLAAKVPNIKEWLEALATQWAIEERLRELGKALRENGHWPGLAPTNCWLSTGDDRWFCVVNPSHMVLDSYGQASPVASGVEVVDARFYPRIAIQDCFAAAAKEMRFTLPDYLRLTIDLEGERVDGEARCDSDHTLAETREALRQPAALARDPGSDGLLRGTLGQRPNGNVNAPSVTFPDQDLAFLPSQPRLTLRLSLIDPARLFAQQRQRTLLYGSALGVSFLAALAGLVAARRAFCRQLRLNELKSNFVSSVSHELRAPIASVRLMAESLERGKIADERKQRDYSRFIGQECRRLSSLIENVLDFSRIEQGRKQYDFEPTDLVALARQTVQLMQTYADQRQITVSLAIRDSQVSILSAQPVVDGKAIQQALVNLIDNAMKHSPQGATVTVGLETPGGDEAGRAPLAPSRVRLWVEDQGDGIPAEEHGKIFERFYRRGAELRRETQGVGIGLSIVKHLVEAHGGTVRVRSAPGQGSRFTIDLPLPGPQTPRTAL